MPYDASRAYGRSMTSVHRYRTDLVWSGSTAGGYRSYSRTHRVSAVPVATPLTVSADPHFGGDADQLNPEQLLLAAASSCHLMSFLALAALAGIDVRHYEDDAEAAMPASRRTRITEITLRPRVVVADGTDLDAVRELVHAAHDGCFIANSLSAEVIIDPCIEHAPPG